MMRVGGTAALSLELPSHHPMSLRGQPLVPSYQWEKCENLWSSGTWAGSLLSVYWAMESVLDHGVCTGPWSLY